MVGDVGKPAVVLRRAIPQLRADPAAQARAAAPLLIGSDVRELAAHQRPQARVQARNRPQGRARGRVQRAGGGIQVGGASGQGREESRIPGRDPFGRPRAQAQTRLVLGRQRPGRIPAHQGRSGHDPHPDDRAGRIQTHEDVAARPRHILVPELQIGGFLDVHIAVLAGKPRLRPLETRRHGIAQRPAHLLFGRL